MKVVNPGKLAFVTRNKREPEGDGVSGDEQIVAAHRQSFLLKTGTEQAIDGVGGFFEGQDFDGAKHGLDLSRQAGRSFLAAP